MENIILNNIYTKALSESKYYVNSEDVYNNDKDDSILEITIINNIPKITKYCNRRFNDRVIYVYNFIKQTCDFSNRTLNVICKIGLHDMYNKERGYDKDLGIMAFSKDKETNYTLIPDIYAILQYYNTLNIKDNISFNFKVNKAVFIGCTTGNENPVLNERLLLCDRINKIKNNIFIDAYISNVCQMSINDVNKVFPNYKEYLYKFVDFRNLHVYKFIISIDGNATSWDRIPRTLISNSICLKKKSSKVNWYYDFMLPDVHYIEFDKEEDLIPIIKKYSSPEEKITCNKIIENSHKFVNDYLILKSHLIYMENLLYILSTKENNNS